MTSSFNSNVSSLKAQRRLATASDALARSFSRLSTGSRINRASDDAAGLSIADSLRVKSRLYTTAQRNINDGLSMISIIGSTLDQQTGILTRLRELAEQSANGTFSSQQRGALNEEYQALLREFARLGDSTTFNGRELLRGTRRKGSSEISLQVGVDGSVDSNVSIRTADTGTLSGNLLPSERGGSSPVNFPRDSYTFEGLQSAYNGLLFSASVVDSSGVKRDLLIGMSRGPTFSTSNGYTARVYQRVSDTGGVGSQSGAGANGDVTSADHEWVYGGDMGSLLFEPTAGIPEFTTLSTSSTLQFMGLTTSGTITLDFRGLTARQDSPNGASAIEFTLISSQTTSLKALTVLANRAAELAQLQGSFGALSSRLEVAKNLVTVGSEVASAAESQIRDIDVASEAAELTRNQILQQTAAQVLAAANTQPELLLSLLTR